MKKILAVILAVIIGSSASLNAFAATAKKTYISDITLVTADTENKAEAMLIKAGYKMLKNCNVNSTLKTAVYIGYKETDNADEALTDIAGMNMLGKFNYSDYKQIMEKNREQIAESIDNFLPALAEYQVNYEAEKPAAVAAHTSLNVFKDDDSGKLMGDYLLDFDFSDNAEKQMTETFMQANSQIIITIMNLASAAGDDEDETMIDRLTDLGPDGVMIKYKGVYPSVAKANQAMAADYGDTAQLIYNEWDNIYDYILNAEENLVGENEDGEITFTSDVYDVKEIKIDENISQEEKNCINGINDAVNTASAAADYSNYALYNLLNDTEYGDGTLLDFFNRPASDVKKEELYPLVEAMSEGQRSQIEINGLLLTLENAFCGIECDTKEAEEAVETVESVTDSLETMSIFEGVDRSIFEDGVAFTSAATEHERLTGETWLAKLTGERDDKAVWLKTMITTSVLTGVLVAAFIGSTFLSRMRDVSQKAYDAAREELTELQNFVGGQNMYFRDFDRLDAFIKVNGEEVEMTKEFGDVFDKIYEDERVALETKLKWEESRICDIASIVKCVSFVMLVVMLAVDAYSIYEYVTADEPQEEKIPHHIITAATTEYGEDYVYYAAVKNLNGEAADTNNHEADAKIGWLTLYTTKDKAAGNPILAENFKLQTGSSSFKEGASFVHLFNESAALNLTDEKYTGVKDSMNGTYITFNRAASTLVGSVVTNGTAAVIGVGSLAFGALLGAMITKLAGRKKKEEASSEA